VGSELEEGTSEVLDFSKVAEIGRLGLSVLPVVLQDIDSREVLFVGYANETALMETLKTKRAVLWSTSRNEIWRKGETSGDVLGVDEVRVNCEQNSILYLCRLTSGSCHTKDASGQSRRSCYYRVLETRGSLTLT
jgi:phosphoribosyl-AMP cyclohydrolase